MWMANNVYSGEARVHDPFLAAVKLLRSRQIAEANNWVPYSISMIGLSGTRPMDILWNSAWWSADFAQMQIELANRYPFMAGSISVSNAASTSDFNHGPTYAWLTPTGAVVSVAGYRIFSPTNFIITLNGTQLGLPTNGNWQFTDIATGTTNFVAAGQPLTVTVSPHSATTLRYSGPMVTGLSATPSNGMASLIWSPVNGATNYYVKRANVSGGPYTVIKSNLIATTYADINVANGTTYYYVVSGVAGGIQTANSFEAGATPNITTGSVSIKVTSISLGIGGAIQLGGTGDVGQAYVLQATTNLVPPVVWLSLLTNNADINGIFNFTDQQAANFSSRYYRITNH